MGRITIREERSGTPGYVEIAVTGIDAATASEGVTIKQRHGDKPYLGPEGWQGQPVYLAPMQVREDGAESVLLYGPEVTGALVLDQDVTLQLSDGTSERHFWPHIAEMLGGAVVDLGIPRLEPQISGTRNVSTEPEVAPEPEPEPEVEDAEQPKPPAEVHTSDDRTKNKYFWKLLAALLLLLIVAGALLVYFWPEQEPQPEEPPQPEPRQQEQSQETPAPPDQPSFNERYETLRDQGGNADALHELSEEANAGGNGDIGFRAMKLAAERGSVAANLQIGEWHDPGVAEDSPFPNPNAVAAARYYRAAGDAGSAEAEDRLRNLCERAANPPENQLLQFENFSINTNCR
ncbi:hypothetical protein [uncultured Roseibium sp.]|uniref:hypothetical protein n=1 Tax=uncultured Roseibium sp. TaxID=1936171 RepID=UPI003216A541